MKTKPNEIVARRRRRILRWAARIPLVCGLLAAAGWLALPLVPLPPALFQEPPAGLEFVDRTGQPLRAVRPDNGPFRRTVTYAEIPRPLIEATLAAEDGRFWRHPGVDWRGTGRAAWQLARHRRVISGGSTITQQLIKLAGNRPRTFRSKFIEAAQALRLEQVWDKQQILAAYLNRLDYGNLNRGCSAAAQYYFAKPLRDLSPAECALLAGLPQAPTRLNPHRHFERAVRRQQWILGRMRQAGWLSEEQQQRALAEPLRLAAPRRVFEAPHFVDLLVISLRPNDPVAQTFLSAGSRDIPVPCFRNRGLESPQNPQAGKPALPTQSPLRTTLDLALNRFAEGTLRRHLARLKAQQVASGAIVVLDNATGDVLALVGSEDYFNPDAGQVNGAWAPRSAGSTFKPFTYWLALERGATPATVIADVPTEFVTATGLFAPANYSRHCYGPMRCRLALANSLNIAAVQVLASLGGPEPLQQRLQGCGLTTLDQTPEHYGLGLTLGNAGARLLELANAYACLARLGEFKPYRLIPGCEAQPALPMGRHTVAQVGNLPYRRLAVGAALGTSRACGLPIRDTADCQPAPRLAADSRAQVASASRSGPSRRVGDPATAYLIADILSDNAARTLAFGAESPLRFDFPVACKTGTSSAFRDNWAFGYTPEFTVGVWAGNPDGSPMHHVSGVTGAGPILHELFEHLHERFGTTWYPTPSNMVGCWVHPLTGKRLRQPPSADSPDAVREKFLASNLPPFEEPEDYVESKVQGPQSSVFSLQPAVHSPQSAIGNRQLAIAHPVRLAAEYRDWLASADNWLGDRAVAGGRADSLRILFPPPGTRLYLDADLPQQGRRLVLRATGSEQLAWQSDSLEFTREGNRRIAWLTQGRHRLVARDPATGAETETWIDVLAR